MSSNKINKLLLVIIIILVLIIVLGAVYFLGKGSLDGLNNNNNNNNINSPRINDNPDNVPDQSQNQVSNHVSDTGNTGDAKITSAYLEVFPSGTDVGPGVRGAPADTISLDSQVGVNLEAEITGQMRMTYKIFNKDGTDSGLVWHGPDLTISNGPYSFCCIENPKASGDYTMKLYLDGKEVKSIPFRVS